MSRRRAARFRQRVTPSVGVPDFTAADLDGYLSAKYSKSLLTISGPAALIDFDILQDFILRGRPKEASDYLRFPPEEQESLTALGE